MTTTETEIDEITAVVEVVYKIECTYCADHAEETLAAGSVHGAARRFHQIGWRATESDTLCPDCADSDTVEEHA